jgi:hypothetical protein
MKKSDIYEGQLNTERIAAYRKLADQYYISETTIGGIFDKGAEWGIEVATRKPVDRPMCSINECDHDVNWRTFYDGGSSWCNKCWCYVDLPPKYVPEESKFTKFLRYIGILPRLKK